MNRIKTDVFNESVLKTGVDLSRRSHPTKSKLSRRGRPAFPSALKSLNTPLFSAFPKAAGTSQMFISLIRQLSVSATTTPGFVVTADVNQLWRPS